jgi:hypothetical protein
LRTSFCCACNGLAAKAVAAASKPATNHVVCAFMMTMSPQDLFFKRRNGRLQHAPPLLSAMMILANVGGQDIGATAYAAVRETLAAGRRIK